MYAAQIFNNRDGATMPFIYGAVTTGDQWKFIKLVHNHTLIDANLYNISSIEKNKRQNHQHSRPRITKPVVSMIRNCFFENNYNLSGWIRLIRGFI